MKSRWTTLCAVFLAGAGATALVVGPSAWAGRAKGDVTLQFGPAQVAGESAAEFLLTLRNEGSADATFDLGDRIELLYRSAGGPGDLTAEELVLSDVPDDLLGRFELLEIRGSGEVGADEDGVDGVALQFLLPVVIEPGSARVIRLDASAATPGAAVVEVRTSLSKASRKLMKVTAKLDVAVAKTLPERDLFYGDASSGDLVVTGDVEFDGLLSYRDITIQSGATLRVPSGTTIRCTGSFTNEGTILVGPGASGGGIEFDPLATDGYFGVLLADRIRPPESGDALTPATIPAGIEEAAVAGGTGGRGLGDAVFSLPPSHYRRGGGGGSGGLGAVGGDGGGVLRVLARGPIVNGGTIDASGSEGTINRIGSVGFDGAGSGGGGGGILILASAVRVENSPEGVLDVSGADGGIPDGLGAGGGGGGGGLVLMIAPTTTQSGALELDGGASQNVVVQTPLTIWSGGGGGGGSVGDGGHGSQADETGRFGPLPDGDGGFVLPPQPGAGQLVIRNVDPRAVWN